MSHAKIDKLAHMANQIGAAFAALPPDEGARGVATHIVKFWTPKMIAETRDALRSGRISLNETASHAFVMLTSESADAP